MNASLRKQSGITFGGFIIGVFVLIILSLFGFRLIPAYIESTTIQRLFDTVSHDPEMQKASVHDILLSYDRRASIENITSIKSSDIQLDKGEDGRPILSASYSVKVKIGGNTSLLMEFTPTSAGK